MVVCGYGKSNCINHLLAMTSFPHNLDFVRKREKKNGNIILCNFLSLKNLLGNNYLLMAKASNIQKYFFLFKILID